MAKHGRHHRSGGRTTPKGTRPAQGRRHPDDRAIDPFLRTIRAALEEPTPVALAGLASSIIETTRERPAFDLSAARPHADLVELLGSFVASGLPETAALAWAMVPMLEANLAEAVQQALGVAPQGPAWLDRFHDMTVTRALEVADVLGDGDNVALELTWPSGHPVSLVVYVDHNFGTFVKDAFTVPDSVAEVERVMRRLGRQTRHGDAQRISVISPADARARLTSAVQRWEMSLGAPESEQWPGTRPLLHWCLSTMPAGGAGYPEESLSAEHRSALVTRFMESKAAARLRVPGDVAERLADLVFWYTGSRGWCDPLQIGLVAVEVGLAEWFPRRIVGPVAESRHLPAVLAAVVRFAHGELRLADHLTDEVLAAVERWTPDYLDAIGASEELDRRSSRELLIDWRDFCIDDLGGADLVARLDDRPHGDEPFDWDGIDPDLSLLVQDVLRRQDALCDEQMDVEFRTLARQVLHAYLVADPQALKRSARTDILAGAVLWVVLGELATFRATRPDFVITTQKQLATAMSVSTSGLASRSATVRGALSWHPLLTDIRRSHAARRRAALREIARLDELIAEYPEV